MPRFRKKPVEVEARQFIGSVIETCKLVEWCGGELLLTTNENYDGLIPTIAIQTLEGVITASYGDWIIQGVQGEFYPCKPDIFDQTYEEVQRKRSPKELEQYFVENIAQIEAEEDCDYGVVGTIHVSPKIYNELTEVCEYSYGDLVLSDYTNVDVDARLSDYRWYVDDRSDQWYMIPCG